MTTSESKGRFFLQNESIRIDSHNESNRIANWNALLYAFAKSSSIPPGMRWHKQKSIRYALAISYAHTASDSQHIHNQTNSTKVLWIMRLTGVENNAKHMST